MKAVAFGFYAVIMLLSEESEILPLPMNFTAWPVHDIFTSSHDEPFAMIMIATVGKVVEWR